MLWHGERIAVHVSASAPGAGVDTPDDLERVRARCSPDALRGFCLSGVACYPGAL